MKSVMNAIKTYEMQGGTASIFLNDDGMQVLEASQAEQRRQYYAEHCIGWIARPADGQHGYSRAGRFKKASNMVWYCQ